MENSVIIQLKSGRYISIQDFKYITYPDGTGKNAIVKNFEGFYLYDHLLTFVGKSSIATLSSSDIEYIQFNGNFSE